MKAEGDYAETDSKLQIAHGLNHTASPAVPHDSTPAAQESGDDSTNSDNDMPQPILVTTHVGVAHPFPLTNQPGFQVILTTLDCLRAYLPVSLPIYRRLQFGRFFEDSSCIITNLQRDDIRGSIAPWVSTCQSGRDDALQKPWVIAFVDRSCRPETEGWIFGTWDADGQGPLVPGTERAREAERLLRGVVETAARLPVLSSIHNATVLPDSHDDPVGLSRDDYGSHGADSNIMLWGAVHETTAGMLQRMGVVSEKFQKSSSVPYHTFVFDIAKMPTPQALPKGLLWGELGQQHFGLVRSRTQIPRQERTMAVLNSLAIYPSKLTKFPNTPPIAWALVGLDGSLTSLHVEEEWRGKGLAKALTTKLFREMMDGFWEDKVRTKWAHGYVAIGNGSSEGMCRSLGGTSEWESYWLRVDLSRAKRSGKRCRPSESPP